MGALYERDAVLADITELVAQAGTGHSLVRFVVGEAGLGKTTLLTHCRERVSNVRVIRAEGSAAESALPFGYLSQVLNLLGGPDGNVALNGLRSAEARAGLYYETLTALTEAARIGPVLLLLDDLHWADPDSLDLLRFVCHRLETLAVAVVGTLRPWPSTSLDIVEELVSRQKAQMVLLEPLSESSSVELVNEESGRLLSSEEAQDAFLACQGNPLLLKFVGERLRHSATGRIAPVGPYRLLISRFGALGGGALRIAQAASVFGTRFPPGLLASVAPASDADVTEGITELSKAGLVRSVDHGYIEFAHPLFAEALYNDLADHVRTSLHARAMRALIVTGADVAEAARHARDGHLVGDLQAVSVLEDAGRAALRAGGIESALLNLRAAAQLAGTHIRSSLRLQLAEAEVAAGHPLEAELASQGLVTSAQDRAIRVEANAILTKAAVAAGRPDRAEEHFANATEAAGDDVDLSIDLLLGAGSALTVVSPPHRLVAWLDHVRGLSSSASRTQRTAVDLTWGMIASISGDPAALGPLESISAVSLDALLEEASPHEGTWIAVNAIHLATMTERYGQGAIAFNSAWALAQRIRSPFLMTHVAVAYADMLCRRGRLAECMQLIDEIDQVTREIPGFTSYTGLPRAFIALHTGHLAETQAACDAVLQHLRPWPEHHPMLWLWLWKLTSEVCLDIGKSEEAARLADSMIEMATTSRVVQPCIVPWADTALAAYLRVGRLRDAETLIGYLGQVSEGWACLWPIAVMETGRAALAEAKGDLDRSEAHHRQAVLLLETVDMPLALVRALIDQGMFFRRTGRPSEAREPLRRAIREAEACGASRLALAATTELHVSGGRRSQGHVDELSAREAQISELAAGGASNADIAAALVISIRTVEHHLQAVYRKTGIRSRRSLSERSSGGIVDQSSGGLSGVASSFEVTGEST